MTRVVRFEQLGGAEVLRIVNEPEPQPGAGEVRLDVTALGLELFPAFERRLADVRVECARETAVAIRPNSADAQARLGLLRFLDRAKQVAKPLYRRFLEVMRKVKIALHG